MMNFASVGVYLDEKCCTNPSRYLPGRKPPVKKKTDLGCEGVYLDEKCRTNPSRYLPGPKTPVKN